MRGQFSQFGSRYLLGRLLVPDDFPEPEGLYIAMTTRIPTDADSGVTIDEPTFEQGYQRAYYGVGNQYWASTGYGTFINTETAEFPPAEQTWARISGYALTTAISGGDVIAYGAAWVSRVPENVQLFVPPGALQVTIRGAAL